MVPEVPGKIQINDEVGQNSDNLVNNFDKFFYYILFFVLFTLFILIKKYRLTVLAKFPPHIGLSPMGCPRKDRACGA